MPSASSPIRAALAEGGNTDLTVRVLPDSGRGLVEWYQPGRMPPPRFPDGLPESMVDSVWGVDDAAPRGTQGL